MKKKKQLMKIVFSFFIILIIVQTNSMARYYEILNMFSGKAIIAEPIIIVEKIQEPINIEVTKNMDIQEYYFKIRNYKLDEKSNKKITEVNFAVFIEIKNSNLEFPIKYELYDCENGEELLKGNNITDKIIVNRNKEFEKIYKLVVSWNDKETISGNLDEIEILVNGSQII